ncbi:hypothetical protein Y032_0005g2346 [Ancylostoma ceylanicum]|uniref:Uncharacterized protein n=1 Tax=Ancylostoma ceylanicum TaxID=53326 RepID=A0A016VSB6_9BILA|nr:hypothetical protein Y032_0005g2346 [Ancylostoma ceylanicum]
MSLRSCQQKQRNTCTAIGHHGPRPFSDCSDIQAFGAQVWELIDLLLPDDTNGCPPLHDTMWNSVGTPLTELQLIYLSGEHDLVKLEHKQSYVLVGLTGGIAVIALAMSIFWGLNGSAFAN